MYDGGLGFILTGKFAQYENSWNTEYYLKKFTLKMLAAMFRGVPSLSSWFY